MTHFAKRMVFLAMALAMALAPCFQGHSARAAGSAAALPDGIYEPDAFSVSGGTGRVSWSCSRVTVRDGHAAADISVSSASYEYVKLGGVRYDAVHGEDVSSFTIPVQLNANNPILAMTSKMSAPHEIEYSVYIHVAQAAGVEAELAGLVYESQMALDYAEGFSVHNYEDGYRLIDIKGGARYLVAPEGKQAPDGLAPDIVVLEQPLRDIYLAATSAMALFDRLDALDAIRMSGTPASGWSIQNAADAMNEGRMLFAGKYSEPDYEMLVRLGCSLAIESTMILHTPKVREMIELLGIPVLIDRSSYERHPLGRTEWIKLYGVLLGKEAEAQAFFDGQKQSVSALEGFANTEKTVAFFYIGSDGTVSVRSATDYVPKMIEIAGGRYVPDGLDGGEDSQRSNVSMTMEAFYGAAVDADYLIYNATIDQPLKDVQDLLGKSFLFADFKAVKEGNVWCTGKYLYQATDILGNLIADIHGMLTGNAQNMTFLYKVE